MRRKFRVDNTQIQIKRKRNNWKSFLESFNIDFNEKRRWKTMVRKQLQIIERHFEIITRRRFVQIFKY